MPHSEIRKLTDEEVLKELMKTDEHAHGEYLLYKLAGEYRSTFPKNDPERRQSIILDYKEIYLELIENGWNPNELESSGTLLDDDMPQTQIDPTHSDLR